ncbi:MAG: hypothetical protein M1822_003239 [Bathelium mastoideum]|nr:MAG: hypothetical protein M1822_003239 [Bathelium mastoideum]
MVLDPFSALGVAGNIVQFVDFSCKLVRNAQSISRSATGASQKATELSAIANDVERLSNAISISSSYPPHLKGLAEQSKSLAAELLKVLEDLQTKGKHPKWESFLVALKEIWKQDKIKDFVHSLSLLQDRLLLNMQSLVTDQQSSVIKDIASLKEENRKMGVTLQNKIDQLQTFAANEIRALREKTKTSLNAFAESTDSPILPLEERVPSLDSLCKALASLELEGCNATREQELFRSLYFPRFRMRHDKIDDAHAQTFGWAFENHLPHTDQPLAFAEWLKRETGVFWVRGKAGAGKSTLMKFVSNHPKTMTYLKEWAGLNELITTQYYFWNSGATLQKSLEGLLRTLLFDILNSSPELVPIAEQELMDLRARDAYEVSDEPWTLKSLVSTLKQVLGQCSGKRFCFFIDGLDEYKGDSDALVELIQCLNEYDFVKTCISSRPWTEFIDAFGQDKDRLIKLEDLTRSDIAKYTSDRLSKNIKLRRLKNLDDRYDILIGEVVDRAQGVFLWVYLVVKSLLEGIRYADSIEDMQIRLETFPPDLEDFFRHMLKDIPQIYRRKTAQTFQLAITAGCPMPLMIYSFADDLDADPLFAINVRTRSMADIEIDRRNEQLPLRLDGRSKGLLEVVPVSNEPAFFKFEVDFLHRTVRDFLQTSADVQHLFGTPLAKSFDPSTILCNCHLAMLKLAPRFYTNKSRVSAMIEGLFHFASQMQQSTGNSDGLISVLDEARSVLRLPLFFCFQGEDDANNQFLAMVVQAGLAGYVDSNTGLLRGMPNRPFLEYALKLPWQKKCFNGTWQLSPQIIRCLLNHGASPNAKSVSGTLWTDFLASVPGRPELHRDILFEALKILVIDGGAHLSARVPLRDLRKEERKEERKGNKVYNDIEDLDENPPERDYKEPNGAEDIREVSYPNPTAFDMLSQIAPKAVADFIMANTSKDKLEKRPADEALEADFFKDSATDSVPQKRV